MSSVDEKEIRELKWWHDHHRDNVIYLIKCLDDLLIDAEHSRGNVEAALVGYKRLYLPTETRVSESETEAKTTN